MTVFFEKQGVAAPRMKWTLLSFLAVAVLEVLVSDHGAVAMPLRVKVGPEGEPKASTPAVKDGLEVVVKPAKAAFAEKEPIVFTVDFANTSGKSFMLFESGFFWDWKIRFGDWQVVQLRDVKRAYPPSQVLEPGKSIRTTVALDSAGGDFHLIWKGDQLALPPPAKFLPAGKYPLVIDVKLVEDVRRERLMDYKFPHWRGTITTNPVEITIAKK